MPGPSRRPSASSSSASATSSAGSATWSAWCCTDSLDSPAQPRPPLPRPRAMTDVLTPPAPPRQPLATEQEAREVAEAAREKEWQAPSFVRELFDGEFRLDLVHPFPIMDPADVERARPFMERLEQFLAERVDSDLIDREGKIPAEVIQGLRDIGAFGIKIPQEY